jgi:hypothetical protein
VNDPTVFRRDCFKPNCATTLFNQRDSALGMTHRMVTEGMWGISWDKPVRRLSEYLDGLLPLLLGQEANATGETVATRGAVRIPNAPAPPVYIAALGPQMLRLTGRRCAGTLTWMTGPNTLARLYAGVVDQDVDAAEPVDGGVHHGVEPVRIGHVGLVGDGTAAVTLDRAGHRLGAVPGAVVYHDVGALPGHGPSDPFPDAAACAGDDCGLSFEFHVVSSVRACSDAFFGSGVDLGLLGR